MPKYYIMDFPDWVNVVPVTSTGEVVLVEQYRHGAGERFLEIPGGSTHPGCEDPLEAGRRELREETGFEAMEWVNCGHHFPNPALQSNRMHTYLALGCKEVGAPNLDPFEDLNVVKVPLKELVRKWERGDLKHSLIAASFALSLPHLRERGML